ncbi:MAG: 4Fe-4S dicluster domain-containing protein [Candidatus Nezhaarchaeales archaeon]
MRIEVLEEKCAACGVCELTCALRHFKANNPKKSMIRVGFLVSSSDARSQVRVCRVCEEKACVRVCPSGALRFNGRWIEVDESLCTLCKACAFACTYEAIFFHEDVKRPLICDLCGGEPQCVKMCPMKALKVV